MDWIKLYCVRILLSLSLQSLCILPLLSLSRLIFPPLCLSIHRIPPLFNTSIILNIFFEFEFFFSSINCVNKKKLRQQFPPRRFSFHIRYVEIETRHHPRSCPSCTCGTRAHSNDSLVHQTSFVLFNGKYTIFKNDLCVNGLSKRETISSKVG